MRQHNLKLHWKKCRWGSTQLKFLGYIISIEGLQMDPKKTDFPWPTTVKSLQRFLGMATFSFRIIPNMTTMTTPLRHLLQKGWKFEWKTQCENNFIQLKDTLHQAGQLAHPDFSRSLLLQTDSSNHGLGVVLLQADTTGAECPICYISRSLTPVEKNYSTTEKKWLAIIWAFTKFYPYPRQGRNRPPTPNSSN